VSGNNQALSLKSSKKIISRPLLFNKTKKWLDALIAVMTFF